MDSGCEQRSMVEALEGRTLLSVAVGADLASAAAKGGGKPVPPSALQIRLDLVVLHELGHSLGIEAHTNNGSIMDPYYNANYDLSKFASDPAVQIVKDLYADETASVWKDTLDANPGNGVVEITYSFMPDGVRMDKGNNTLFSTFDKKFGAGEWQDVFRAQFDRWENALGGILTFAEVAETGKYGFNVFGKDQNDARFGDIRIGSHKFDGVLNELAHSYFPPPNGWTAAGDTHFDSAENWVLNATRTSAGTEYSGEDTTVFAHQGAIVAGDAGGANDILLRAGAESLFGAVDEVF